MNKRLLEIVRDMMNYATLPMSLRIYFINNNNTLNMVPSKSILKISTELWLGRESSNLATSTFEVAQYMY